MIWSGNGQYISRNFGVKLGKKFNPFLIILVVDLFDRNIFYKLKNFATILHTCFYHLNM